MKVNVINVWGNKGCVTRDYGTDTIDDDVKIIGVTVQGTKVITS